MDYDEYYSERSRLDQSLQSQYDSFDKYLLLLSGGSFGISLSFFNSIAQPIKGLSFLIISWFGFCLSILLTLISFLLSQKYHNDLIRQLDNMYEHDIKIKFKQNCIVERFNWLSMISFVLGITSIIVFAIINFRGSK